jgi:hypothetical protein
MITFSRLGKYGRLGNQLFQIASTVGYALDNNQEFCFDWEYSEYFNMKRTSCATHTTISEIDTLNHNILPIYDKSMGNVDMFGYFQSYKYFQKYNSIIFDLFELKPNSSNYGFIHIRRGDYIKYPNHHPIMPLFYYEEAIKKQGKDKYLCFSDDVVWCKENIKNPKIEIMEDVSEIETLKYMIGCDTAIIANSSFSWWGAYLGRHHNVIAPRNWFGSAYSGYRIEDKIPNSWEVL